MSESYIKRIKRANNFTIIGNNIFSSGLSIESVGVICYILHLPDDWIIRRVQLMKHFNIGRDKMNRIFGELKSVGYLAELSKIRGKNGKFDGINYIVYDEPNIINHHTEKPRTAEPLHGKPTTTKNYLNKELSKQRTILQRTNNNAEPKNYQQERQNFFDDRYIDNMDLLKFK